MPSNVVRLRAVAAAAILVVVAGCSASRPSPSGAPQAPPSPEQKKAEAECADVATRATENVTPQTQASKAAIGIYLKCMADKGFPLNAGS